MFKILIKIKYIKMMFKLLKIIIIIIKFKGMNKMIYITEKKLKVNFNYKAKKSKSSRICLRNM